MNTRTSDKPSHSYSVAILVGTALIAEINAGFTGRNIVAEGKG